MTIRYTASFDHNANADAHVDKEETTNLVDLAIFDEMLPCDFSPFRSIEYSHYLSLISSSALVSLEGWHGGAGNLSYDEMLKKSTLPDKVKQKIIRFSCEKIVVPKLAYITFLNNAVRLLPYLTERKIPFVLQLYPGGGFEPNTVIGDRNLKQVVSSPLCRHIIATQNYSYNYLKHADCDMNKVSMIYGGVFNTRNYVGFYSNKQRYGIDKNTLDVCFVAHRYSDNFKQKGYDQFVEVAKLLAQQDIRARFHVIGDYSPSDIPLGHASELFTFYGSKPQSFFSEFYPRMDIILSANRPIDGGSSGAFDGFPTGACMEAGFYGVLNCITDPLGMNIAFCDNENIVIIDYDPQSTAQRILDLFADPSRLYALAHLNQARFLEVFNVEMQLQQRTSIIIDELLKLETLVIRPSATFSILQTDDGREAIKSAQAQAQDSQRRHDNLLAEYQKLAAGFENIVAEYKKLENLRDDLLNKLQEMGGKLSC